MGLDPSGPLFNAFYKPETPMTTLLKLLVFFLPLQKLIIGEQKVIFVRTKIQNISTKNSKRKKKFLVG